MKLDTHLPSTPSLQPAHPLFPVDQALLWLPGLPGEHLAFCSYNEMRGIPGSDNDRRLIRQPAADENGAFFAPPFPVSRETFIAWHTNISPPFPFHPIPISRTLSDAELAELAKRVSQLLEENPQNLRHPLEVLRNDHKCLIITALAAMDLLSRQGMPHRTGGDGTSPDEIPLPAFSHRFRGERA